MKPNYIIKADIEQVEATLDSLDSQRLAALTALEQATISESDFQAIRE